MSDLYHMLLHLTGLCGEAHPSIYTLVAALIALPFKSVVMYIYDKINL
jgi:hypothetical protein